MKIVVFSDSHGNYPAMVRAVELIPEIDEIVHLGDLSDDVLPLQAAIGRGVIRVSGNCDAGSPVPTELLVTFGEVPFLLCHGDTYGVKGGLSRLAARARQAAVQVVLFGHTHVPGVEELSGILFVNPGTLHKGAAFPTFAVVAVEDGRVSATIVPAGDPAAV